LEQVDAVLMRPIGSLSVQVEIRLQITTNLAALNEFRKLTAFLAAQRTNHSTLLSVYVAVPSGVDPTEAALGFSDFICQLVLDGAHRAHRQLVARCSPELTWTREDPDEVIARLKSSLAAIDPRSDLPDSIKGGELEGRLMLCSLKGGWFETPARSRPFRFEREACDAQLNMLVTQELRKSSRRRGARLMPDELIPISIPAKGIDNGYRWPGAKAPHVVNLRYDPTQIDDVS
jgi:hypothetical protein